MKVLVFGSLNIDRTFFLPHFLREGETLHSLRMSVQAGGKGANQAVALAKAGAHVSLAGTIGADGRWLLPLLSSYGVDTSLVNVREELQSGTADILVDEKGGNGIVLSGGANMENGKEYIDSVFSSFSSGDVVVLQNEVNNLEYLFRKAAERGMKIVFNPSPMEESLRSLPLSSVYLLVLNEIESASLSSVDGSYDEMLSSLVSSFPDCRILLTAGGDGSFYGCGNERHHQEAVKCDVCDTTAAGDTFLGYFLALVCEGRSVEDAMAMAARASSITVSRPGAMDSIPLRAEVLRPCGG